jgi:RNA polymerase sigma-70 factor (ECF subfamily)
MDQASGTLLLDDVPDVELARRIGAEDRDALGLLVRRHHRLLYRTAYSILKDDAEAEDAVQDAYMHAYQGIGGYRGQAKLSTWLVRIVVNESLARLRRRKRASEVIQVDGEIAAAGADSVSNAHN